jgi:hypothetical protein
MPPRRQHKEIRCRLKKKLEERSKEEDLRIVLGQPPNAAPFYRTGGLSTQPFVGRQKLDDENDELFTIGHIGELVKKEELEESEKPGSEEIKCGVIDYESLYPSFMSEKKVKKIPINPMYGLTGTKLT